MCCLALVSEAARTNQSSRYQRSQTPQEWAQADTVAKTLVNTEAEHLELMDRPVRDETEQLPGRVVDGI